MVSFRHLYLLYLLPHCVDHFTFFYVLPHNFLCHIIFYVCAFLIFIFAGNFLFVFFICLFVCFVCCSAKVRVTPWLSKETFTTKRQPLWLRLSLRFVTKCSNMKIQMLSLNRLNSKPRYLNLCITFPLIFWQGFNGTIFAYGQTGAGKSYTMEGGKDPATEGLMPRAFRHIIDKIGLNTNKEKKFLIRATYLEIYNEMVRDLLGKDPTKSLKVKQVNDHCIIRTFCSSGLVSVHRNRNKGCTLKASRK